MSPNTSQLGEVSDGAWGEGSERLAGPEPPIAGTIRSVTLKSLAGAPSLEAEIYDGSGSVVAVFLGRRRIPGIEAGRSIVLHGRLTQQDHRNTIFNPRYELICEGAKSA